MTVAEQPALDLELRAIQFYRFLVEQGGYRRYGSPDWRTPERTARIEMELEVIEGEGFSPTFVMLADIMRFCRDTGIAYGPGRGSVGGCYTAYLAGIHDVDSIEWDLLFERFLNRMRVTPPDVDIDVSQRDRSKVLDYIVERYTREDQVVLQIGAFVRAGGRAVVDLVATAMAQHDQYAWATATNLKKCFPASGSITGGQKIARELHAWLNEGKGHGDKEQFRELAEQAGWLDTLLKLDGMFLHLGKHAAGVVILRTEDLPLIPKVTVTETQGKKKRSYVVTGYDMYSLDALGYPKWDFLGLRTLDVITDAHRFAGGSGRMDDLLAIWQEHRDDPEPYELLAAADTAGIFQMDTDGYKRTLRDFVPENFDHVVQLVALYRPGALDFRENIGTEEEPIDGRNMVQVFIDRRHNKEVAQYDHPALQPILGPTHGIILYQEQQMAIAKALAGFDLRQADALRKAIGKKRADEMAVMMAQFDAGCERLGIQPAVQRRIRANLEAAARYSWNKSHAVEYAIITWWTAYFKSKFPAAFYAAEINSWEDKKERQAYVIAEARQHAEFRPPDVNVAEDHFIVKDGEIVFGLNGIKGMGDSYRGSILVERMMSGPFTSFSDFCLRLPKVPINMKLALVKCGAFDGLDQRTRLLAKVPKAGKDPDATWTVAEHLNHNRKLKTPRPLPDDLTLYHMPSDFDIAQGELESMGYYISTAPLKNVTKALARHSKNVIGGEIEKVTVKEDKNHHEYGQMQIVTPALTKQRVLIFASNWPTFKSRCEKGAQLIFRGREDGGTFLADGCWAWDDVRHHKKIRVWRGDEKPTQQDFDGRMETIHELERSGYRVRLL